MSNLTTKKKGSIHLQSLSQEHLDMIDELVVFCRDKKFINSLSRKKMLIYIIEKNYQLSHQKTDN